MKIIIADSLDQDYFQEEIVIEGVCKECADKVAAYLNKTYRTEESETFFKVVSDDYELETFDL
jgi:hypothetical protein